MTAAGRVLRPAAPLVPVPVGEAPPSVVDTAAGATIIPWLGNNIVLNKSAQTCCNWVGLVIVRLKVRVRHRLLVARNDRLDGQFRCGGKGIGENVANGHVDYIYVSHGSDV